MTYVVFTRPGYDQSSFYHFTAKVEKETDKRVTISGASGKHIAPSQIVARFADEESAVRLRQHIDAARGEYRRRVTAAQEATRATIARLIAEATK